MRKMITAAGINLPLCIFISAVTEHAFLWKASLTFLHIVIL